jgi:hypothetical protein
MDVTPTPKMLQAMKNLVDATCGDEPSPLLVGPGVSNVRVKRAMMMDVLHSLVALSMREGVNRMVKEVQARREGFGFTDAEDRSAIDQATDDAHAGRTRVRVRH